MTHSGHSVDMSDAHYVRVFIVALLFVGLLRWLFFEMGVAL